MDVQKIQQTIDALHYWDAWVVTLSCDQFADEVTLVYEDEEGNVTYKFSSCYKTVFEHGVGYDKEKPVRELTRAQMPYFLHDVEVGEIEKEGISLYTCKIAMPPMNVEIWCKKIEILR